MTAEQVLTDIRELAKSHCADPGISTDAWALGDEIIGIIDAWKASQVKATAPEFKSEETLWVVADHKGWGDSILYLKRDTEADEHRWVGHTTPHPKVGDWLVAKTNSGITAAFQINKMDYPPLRDPGDMWFARTATRGRVLHD